MSTHTALIYGAAVFFSFVKSTIATLRTASAGLSGMPVAVPMRTATPTGLSDRRHYLNGHDHNDQ